MPKLSKTAKRGTRNRTNIRAMYPFDSARIRVPSEEIKLFPQSGNNSYFDGAAGQYMVDLTPVTQGNSGAQRAGDVLYLTALHLKCVLSNGMGTTSNIRNLHRVIIFQYLGDNSAAGKPTIADFLQISTNNVGNTYGSWSTLDIDYARQYRVLWDSGLVLTVGSNALAPTGVPAVGNFHVINMNVPLARAQRNIAYYTGGVTGPNHIYMLFTSDQATQTTNPSAGWTTEVRFTDA